MCIVHIYNTTNTKRLSTQEPPVLSPQNALHTEQQALTQAVQAVLAPLAELCVARGLPIQAVEEQIRLVFVNAAQRASEDAGSPPNTSRISAATGLTRREVSRLLNQPVTEDTQRPSPTIQVFTRWLADPRLRGGLQQPRALARQGATDSFEWLAQSVTRDVHPRTLLDELCRLGLATLDPQTDTVSLKADAFVPRQDWSRMVGFLGRNVGDHLSAATANVLGDGHQHFEQAIYADELSEASMAEVRSLVSEAWKQLLETLVPQIEALIDADRQAKRPSHHQIRIGLFTWAKEVLPQTPEPPSPPTHQGVSRETK